MPMEHKQIDDDNLVDRYVRGTMPVDLRTEFEEHFLDCPDCLEQLKLASNLRDGLRLCGADLAAAAEPQREAPRRARERGLFAWRWWPIVAAACLVLGAAPSLIFFRELGSVKNDLSRDQAALSAAKKTIDSVERAGITAFILSPVRGGVEPTRIVVPAAPPWTVLTLESDFTRFGNYRAALRNDQGGIVWQRDQIRPTSPDAIGIALSPALAIAPGVYILTLEGEADPGRYVPAATFSFSVSRTP
jgi:hypothetical protein